MPIYDLDHFKHLARTNGWQFLNKRKALKTQIDLGWSNEQVEIFLLGIISSDFQKSVPNLTVNDLIGIDRINGDQYAVSWNEENMVHADTWNKESFEISIKIAIISIGKEQLAGAITFHLS